MPKCEACKSKFKDKTQSISATTARPCGENLNLKAQSKPKFKIQKLI